jgi:hypothetical protein
MGTGGSSARGTDSDTPRGVHNFGGERTPTD